MLCEPTLRFGAVIDAVPDEVHERVADFLESLDRVRHVVVQQNHEL